MKNIPRWLCSCLCLLLLLCLGGALIACGGEKAPAETIPDSLGATDPIVESSPDSAEESADAVTNPETAVESADETAEQTEAVPETDVDTAADTAEETVGDTDGMTDAETVREPETFPETTGDELVASFAVFSDVHLGKNNVSPRPEAKFADVLEQLNALMPDCDAVLFAGDITDLGTDAQYESFMKIWNAGKPAGAQLGAVMGNHEYFRDGVVRYGGESAAFLKECQNAFTSIVGERNTDIVVGGVHMIGISADSSAAQYASSEQYILDHVKAAAEEDPTKPIILYAHQGVGAYHVDGGGVFTAETTRALAQYPQLIVFSGHTHFSLYDPRMIAQKTFTTIQTSTMGADLWNYNGWNPLQHKDKDKVSEGHLVTVTADGVVTVTRYDFFRKTTVGREWVIDIPAVTESRANFTYTDARKNQAADPAFPASAQVETSQITASGVTVTFPAATVTDSVSDGQIYKYSVSVTAEGDSKPILSKDIQGEYYLGKDATDTYTVALEGLLDSTAYVVTVTAETPWGKTASILSLPFTTQAGAGVDDSDAKTLLYVDYTSGSPEDQSDLKLTMETFGAPAIRDGVAVIDSDSAYAYKLTQDVYDAIPANLTLEFSVYIEAQQVYPWGYCTLVGNTEAGGFGICLYNNGNLQVDLNNGPGYQILQSPAPIGRWTHVAMTYDGASLRLYVDGVLAATTPCTGNIKHVAEISRKLMVGGDVNGQGVLQTGSNIQIKYIRLYDKPLNARTIAELAAESNG